MSCYCCVIDCGTISDPHGGRVITWHDRLAQDIVKSVHGSLISELSDVLN